MSDTPDRTDKKITDRLDAITARASAAYEGPWEAHTDMFQDESHRDVEGSWIPGVAEKDFYDGDKPALSMLDIEDAEFIASSRTDVPEMVATLRAVLEACDRIDASLVPHGDFEVGQKSVTATIRTVIESAFRTPFDMDRLRAALGEDQP